MSTVTSTSVPVRAWAPTPTPTRARAVLAVALPHPPANRATAVIAVSTAAARDAPRRRVLRLWMLCGHMLLGNRAAMAGTPSRSSVLSASAKRRGLLGARRRLRLRLSPLLGQFRVQLGRTL